MARLKRSVLSVDRMEKICMVLMQRAGVREVIIGGSEITELLVDFPEGCRLNADYDQITDRLTLSLESLEVKPLARVN